jgi:integrase
VARERKGTITERGGKFYARVQFTDETGKRRDVWRKVDNRTKGRQVIRQLLTEIENSTPTSLDAANLRFDELAAHFETNYLKPAEYVDGRKVAGVRSFTPAFAAVHVIKNYFGKKKLRNITYADITSYRSHRLKTPTRHGKQRAIATVNRELDKLRRMFNIAIQQGWLSQSPFKKGGSLISLADETHRERILSRDEESRLLAAIEAEPLREHLKGIVMIALDCALRRGEILTLTWSDVNLENRTINVRAFNAKTARARTVAMTNRVFEDLRGRSEAASNGINQFLFSVKDVKRSFRSACRQAGISDFRLHDCRHTAITRMIRAGIPPVEVMRVSGHQTLSCFYRYSNLDSDTVFRVASALDAYHADTSSLEVSSAVN